LSLLQILLLGAMVGEMQDDNEAFVYREFDEYEK